MVRCSSAGSRRSSVARRGDSPASRGARAARDHRARRSTRAESSRARRGARRRHMRLNRWAEAVAPAKACTERAPSNVGAWSVYARALVRSATTRPRSRRPPRARARAARSGPAARAGHLARCTQDPQAEAAQAAYVRFRSPDEAAVLRIRCAKQRRPLLSQSQSCADDRAALRFLLVATGVRATPRSCR